MSHRLPFASCLLPLLLCLPAPALAQGGQSAWAVAEHDGAIEANGPDYRARFDARGVDFVAVGAGAASHLRFSLESVRRGAVDLARGEGSTAPVVDGERVCYRHDALWSETYEARADGLEQSFVFAERPAGHGDLVVRGAIATALPLLRADADGVRYQQDGRGIAFGAVTGIDANGHTARGSLRAGPDWVEWVLPAAFVDAAAYPLVLDPLIGSAFTIGNSPAGTDVAPRIAYEASIDRYLVIWSVPTSTDVAELRGQFVGGNGSLAGTSFVIEAQIDATVRPDVACVQSTDRFLVAFRRNAPGGVLGSTDTETYVRSISAANGTMSALVQLFASGLFTTGAREIVVGGDRRPSILTGNNHALVVVRRPTGTFVANNSIESYYVYVPASGNPTIGVAQSLASTPDAVGDLAISSHCGTNVSSGRWLATWCQAPGPTTPYIYVMGHVVDDSGLACGFPIPVVAGTTGVQRPTVATSTGLHFAVAWQDDASLGLRLRTMTWSGTCASGAMTLGAIGNPVSAGIDSRPQLEFAKDKYVLAWRRAYLLGTPARVYVKGLSPDLCAACGSEWLAESSASALNDPALSARWSGGDGTSDEALLAWSNGTIRGRRFQAIGGGTVTSLGGACGISGFDDLATYSGEPVLGALDFQLELVNPSAPILALVIGLSNVSIPCGPCVLVPALDILASGVTPNPLPLPCDLSYLGVQFTTQWLLWKPGGCSLFPDFALSNALQFTVGE